MSSSTIRPIVAIAGGTGQLGRLITNALLSEQFSSFFKEVRLLSSNTSSEAAHLLASRGAKIIEVNYSDEQSILSAIYGADVLINSLGGICERISSKECVDGGCYQRRLC
jgi:uncharacterized protein YbjT (DUF2867 family)